MHSLTPNRLSWQPGDVNKDKEGENTVDENAAATASRQSLTTSTFGNNAPPSLEKIDFLVCRSRVCRFIPHPHTRICVVTEYYAGSTKHCY